MLWPKTQDIRTCICIAAQIKHCSNTQVLSPKISCTALTMQGVLNARRLPVDAAHSCPAVPGYGRAVCGNPLRKGQQTSAAALSTEQAKQHRGWEEYPICSLLSAL